ncbi:MAG: exodeoxyribonuclease VII large subunit [Clostridia bacterium]|nr:exodeoxyribonuclease VII large subunit [Clostridia bacterium]
MNPPIALSVEQLNLYVKSLLESDRNLKSVWLRGEVSNFVRNSKSGHCYFSIKDRNASVKAVMFKWQASNLTFVPKDGMQVLVRGKVSLYERDGQYQFYTEEMFPDGLGGLYLEFLRIKDTLEKEGLFDRKKPLPAYPRAIGICTSVTGAAVRDILSVCSRLAPSVPLCVYPCLMQGVESPRSVMEGLEYFRTRPDVDLVMIARGGGSYEDLAVFNDESLARLVADYPLPVISAIGHETDFTILDFVSDVRAATPSVAAELAVGQAPALSERLIRAKRSVMAHAAARLRFEEQKLQGLTARLDPTQGLQTRAQALDYLDFRLKSAAERQLQRRTSDFSELTARLTALNPLSVLSRGYALAESDGVPVRSAEQINPGESLMLHFQDGVIGCVAEYKEIRKL